MPVIWAALGTGVLAAVGITLFLTAGGQDGTQDPGVDPSITAAPHAGRPRRGRADRAAGPHRGARRPVGEVRLGPGRLAASPETPGSGPAPTPEPTSAPPEQSVRLLAPARVCVQVRLVRGQFASPWADECVD